MPGRRPAISPKNWNFGALYIFTFEILSSFFHYLHLLKIEKIGTGSLFFTTSSFAALSAARYFEHNLFVAKGIYQGKRADLVGGGLIRSTSGWTAVKAMQKAKIHDKSDERNLGDSDFVDQILSEANEALERKYALQSKGVDLKRLAEMVAGLMQMPVEDIWLEGRYKKLVTTRSLLCFWAVRELRLSMSSLALKPNISTAAVSKSVKRGEDVAKEGGKLIS